MLKAKKRFYRRAARTGKLTLLRDPKHALSAAWGHPPRLEQKYYPMSSFQFSNAFFTTAMN